MCVQAKKVNHHGREERGKGNYFAKERGEGASRVKRKVVSEFEGGIRMRKPRGD